MTKQYKSCVSPIASLGFDFFYKTCGLDQMIFEVLSSTRVFLAGRWEEAGIIDLRKTSHLPQKHLPVHLQTNAT